MYVNINKVQRFAVVKLVGGFGAETSAKVAEAIRSEANDTDVIILDLSECEYLSSTGIGTMISLSKSGVDLIVVIPLDNYAVRSVAENTNLPDFMNVFDNMETAMAFVAYLTKQEGR